MRPILVAAALLLAGCAGGPADAPAADASANACAFACPRALDATLSYVREPMLAVGPSDPLHLVVAAQDSPERVSWDVALVSRDGGLTWARARIPGGPSAEPTHALATATRTSDPVAAILRDGTVLYAGLAAHATVPSPVAWAAHGVTLFVARSEDGGLTYPDVEVLERRPGATSFVFFPAFSYVSALQDDKPWMAVGPRDETLLVWSHHVAAPARSEIRWSLTTDAGRTWSSPAAIESAHGVVWGASPAILADSWSVAYVSGGQGPDGFHYDLLLASSRDAGRTWQVSTIAESVPFQSPQLRADARSGDLVVAYAEGPDAASFGDVVVRVLPAAGGAWSETARFTGLGDAAMDPQVALDVAPDGSVYLAFWALDDAGGSQRHAALGRDGWTRSVLGAGAASGEYTGLAAWDGGAFAVWPRWDADAPTLDGARVPLP